jgi:hypothetical protein
VFGLGERLRFFAKATPLTRSTLPHVFLESLRGIRCGGLMEILLRAIVGGCISE